MPAQFRVFRDAWAGGTDGTLPGLADGARLDVPKASYEPPATLEFRTPEEVFGTAASLNRIIIDSLIPAQAQPPVPLVVGDGFGGGPRTFFGGPIGADNPGVLVDLPLLGGNKLGLLARIPTVPLTGFFEDASHLYEVQLRDADWGRVAAVELRLDNPVEEYALLIANIPEVRARIGGDPPDPGAIAAFHLYLDNVKAGELDATDSFRGVDLQLALASDGPAGQNSFAALGSGFADRVALSPGRHPGVTADGVVLDTSGAPALVTALLGAGDDVFDAGTTAAATEIAGGADAGRFFVGAQVVSLGYGDGPFFSTLGFDPAAPRATTADLLRDWVEDAAAGLPAGGFALTATVNAGTIAAQSSTVATEADIPGARYFTGTAIGAPRDPFPEPQLGAGLLSIWAGNGFNGLGMSQSGPPVTFSRDPRNTEIGEYLIWTPETGLAQAHDELGVRFGTDAIAARIDLSAFYSQERGPGAGELVRIALYDDGVPLLERDFASELDTGAAAQVQAFNTPLNPGTGHVTLDAAALGIGRFDEIRIIGFQVDEADPNSNDMLLDGIRLVLPGEGYAVLGGDVLRAGAGPDRFRYAPGDGVDTIERFAAGQDELLLQGIRACQVTLEETGGGTALRFAGDPDALIWLPGTTGLSVVAACADTLIG
jgi:hypothetical protein